MKTPASKVDFRIENQTSRCGKRPSQILMTLASMKEALSQKDTYYHTVARNLFLNQEFTKILDSFSQEHIRLIPLKGIALIQKIYSDIGSRYIGDIDLLVRPGDVLSSAKLLNELGYFNQSCYRFNPEKPYSDYLNSMPFSKPAKIPSFVHLHWHLLNATIPLSMYKIPMEEIWQSAEPERYQDKQMLMLAPHHLVVYLSVHAFKHSFNKISLFHDIEKAIEFYRDRLDWKAITKVAAEWGATLPLYYSLYLTSKILKADIPEHTLSIIRPKKISKAGYRAASSISGDQLGTHKLVYPLYLDMLEGSLNRTKFIFLTLFPPPEQLRQIYSVNSKYLVFGYYLKRLGNGLVRLLQE